MLFGTTLQTNHYGSPEWCFGSLGKHQDSQDAATASAGKTRANPETNGGRLNAFSEGGGDERLGCCKTTSGMTKQDSCYSKDLEKAKIMISLARCLRKKVGIACSHVARLDFCLICGSVLYENTELTNPQPSNRSPLVVFGNLETWQVMIGGCLVVECELDVHDDWRVASNRAMCCLRLGNPPRCTPTDTAVPGRRVADDVSSAFVLREAKRLWTGTIFFQQKVSCLMHRRYTRLTSCPHRRVQEIPGQKDPLPAPNRSPLVAFRDLYTSGGW